MRDVRGCAWRRAGATPDAVVAGDPRARRAVVSRQRVARRAPAARGARTDLDIDGVRAPPIAGVLLTDAEIDHTAGLLLLRESATPILRLSATRASSARSGTGTQCWRFWSATAGAEWQDARTGPGDRTGGVEPHRRGVRRGRRRAALPRRLGHGARGKRAGVPRPRGSGRGDLCPRPGAIGRRRAQPIRRQRPRSRRRDLLGQRRSCPAWHLDAQRARHGASARSRAPAGRSRCSPGCSGRARRSSTSTTPTRSCSRTHPSVMRSFGPGVEIAYDGLEVEL